MVELHALVYDEPGPRVVTLGHHHLSSMVELAAEVLTSACSNPGRCCQVVRTRVQQRQEAGRSLRYGNTRQAFRTILAREGFRGLYRGMAPHVLRVMPQSAITFLVYERMVQLLHAFAAEGGLSR